jgi:hypothetical protein
LLARLPERSGHLEGHMTGLAREAGGAARAQQVLPCRLAAGRGFKIADFTAPGPAFTGR